MDIKATLLIIIFAIAIFSIAFEQNLGVNKSWIALFAGTIMWIIISVGVETDMMNHAIREGSAEIFELIVFLIGAMTIVEMMAHFRFFTWIEVNLLKLQITNKRLFWILGLITFFASAVLDNLTATLIMIQIGRRLYIRPENFNIFVINTVIAANAGGAMSPVGDVTTIMMWLDQKFTAWQILQFGFLPSLAAWAIPQAMLTPKMVLENREGRDLQKMLPLQWYIIIMGFSTFGFAVTVNLVHLPPFMGILFGLGVSAIIIDYKLKKGKLKKVENKIVNVIKAIDMTTIIFFIGILLAVNALSYQGILSNIAYLIFGDDPGAQATQIIIGHTVLGLVSSVLDNVPLTAAVIDMLPGTVHYQYWVLLAITAGTGGSILVIGSAAGVAAMGQVPTLRFKSYLKLGTLPALVGYFAAIAIWLLTFNFMVK